MSNDPSTEREEAAEDAADLWTHQQGYAMTGTEWGAFGQGHLAGSAWARTRLATQEPTDAEIEAAANALADWDGADWHAETWDWEIPREAYRAGARRALSAARAVGRGAR